MSVWAKPVGTREVLSEEGKGHRDKKKEKRKWLDPDWKDV